MLRNTHLSEEEKAFNRTIEVGRIKETYIDRYNKLVTKEKNTLTVQNKFFIREILKNHRDIRSRIDREQCQKLIEKCNELLADKFLTYGKLSLPQSLGTLYYTKINVIPKLKDGKLVGKKYIDWVKTVKYWEEHPETKHKSHFRSIRSYAYYIVHKCRRSTNYNLSFYVFTPARSLTKKIYQCQINNIYIPSYE